MTLNRKSLRTGRAAFEQYNLARRMNEPDVVEISAGPTERRSPANVVITEAESSQRAGQTPSATGAAQRQLSGNHFPLIASKLHENAQADLFPQFTGHER
jgi:hypothetical protein